MYLCYTHYGIRNQDEYFDIYEKFCTKMSQYHATSGSPNYIYFV